MRDKTQDDRFFILTLFAIAKELARTGSPSPLSQVDLAVGLPPEHYGVLKDRFADYFRRKEPIRFVYCDRPYMIAIIAKILGVAFAVFTVFVSFVSCGALQVNTISSAVSGLAGTNAVLPWIIAGLILVIDGLVIFGGVKKIADVTTYLTPIMAIIYLGFGLIVLIMKLHRFLIIVLHRFPSIIFLANIFFQILLALSSFA